MIVPPVQRREALQRAENALEAMLPTLDRRLTASIDSTVASLACHSSGVAAAPPRVAARRGAGRSERRIVRSSARGTQHGRRRYRDREQRQRTNDSGGGPRRAPAEECVELGVSSVRYRRQEFCRGSPSSGSDTSQKSFGRSHQKGVSTAVLAWKLGRARRHEDHRCASRRRKDRASRSSRRRASRGASGHG